MLLCYKPSLQGNPLRRNSAYNLAFFFVCRQVAIFRIFRILRIFWNLRIFNGRVSAIRRPRAGSCGSSPPFAGAWEEAIQADSATLKPHIETAGGFQGEAQQRPAARPVFHPRQKRNGSRSRGGAGTQAAPLRDKGVRELFRRFHAEHGSPVGGDPRCGEPDCNLLRPRPAKRHERRILQLRRDCAADGRACAALNLKIAVEVNSASARQLKLAG